MMYWAPLLPLFLLSVITFPTMYRARVHLACSQSDTVRGSMQIPGLHSAKKKRKEKETTYIITDGVNQLSCPSIFYSPAHRALQTRKWVHAAGIRWGIPVRSGFFVQTQLRSHLPGTVLEDAWIVHKTIFSHDLTWAGFPEYSTLVFTPIRRT